MKDEDLYKIREKQPASLEQLTVLISEMAEEEESQNIIDQFDNAIPNMLKLIAGILTLN